MSEVKPVFKCDEAFKHIFSRSQCLLTISVGQEVHEGEKFATTLALVNESFQSCILLIDDTLQRHTMAIETDIVCGDALLAVSKEEGRHWLQRNKAVIDKLTIPCTIITWDKWLNHPHFAETRVALEALYGDDAAFRATIDETIDEFLTRYDRRSADFHYLSDARVRKLCLDYLVEECSAMCLWPELHCHFEVYPSHRNAAMAETHRRFVLPEHDDLLRPVRVKFKNKKQLKPQIFQLLNYGELCIAS